MMAVDLDTVQHGATSLVDALAALLLQLPGSTIVLRYVRSSYQDDPVRSGIELFLCLFALRYLLAPAYSTQKKNYARLSEQVGYISRILGRAFSSEGALPGEAFFTRQYRLHERERRMMLWDTRPLGPPAGRDQVR